MTPRPLRGPRVPEAVVQRQVVHLLRSVGGRLWITGTHRRRGDHQGTMMTPGIPDILAFVHGRLVFVEVKGEGGRLRPEQRDFRDLAQTCGIDHVVGGVDAVIAYLVGRGLLRVQQLAHYRVPAVSPGGSDGQ